MTATLYYVHDPMCSWCWGFQKTYKALIAGLPDEVKLVRLLGGLAPDNEEIMPGEMQTYIKNHWRTIQEKVPGTKFNYDFWEKCIPRRSTYPACRAVIAARNQGEEYDIKMTNAIQQAYYLHARNPSVHETLIKFASEMNLDTGRFSSDLMSKLTEERLQQEINFSRQLGVTGFPNLFLESQGMLVHIATDYNDPDRMLLAVKNKLGSE